MKQRPAFFRRAFFQVLSLRRRSPPLLLSRCTAMKPPEGEDHLHLCRHLLSSLADSVPAVLSFRGRWTAVSAKLDRLRAALSDLSDLPDLHSNPLSADLLRSLSPTLSSALDLSLRCHSADPPAGKLRTQSDIAAAAAALDRHIADADLLVRTGALLDPPRAAADRPSPAPRGSRRELVRVEARNLVTRLQIGGAAPKNAALDELIGLLREDDKNVLIAAAQGAIPALVRLLDSSCQETKEKAVAAISRVSSIESCRHVLAAEGVPLLNHLARLLDSGAGSSKENACLALQTLTLSRENARALGCRGGICSLLEICQAGTPSSQAAAAGVLKNLAAMEEIREALKEEGSVSVLIRLCSLGTTTAQENSIACLRNLASGDGLDLKLLISGEGGIDCLKNYWDRDGRNLESAAGLLRHLASCRLISEVLVDAGFVARAVAVLGSSSAATRTEAARALYELAVGSHRAAKDVGETGSMTRLVRMLEAKGSEEKEAAAMAVASLVAVADNRRIFKKDERGIMNMVQLLDPLLPTVNKKYPIVVLQSVSQSRKCRKRMVEAGACWFLQRLVEMEVEGAGRLLEALGKCSIWGAVFSRT